MSRQLAFELGATASHARADFRLSAANALALRAIDGWADWPQGKLVLVGPAGSGKTHLARIWAAEAGAAVVAGAGLAAADLPGLAARGRVAVEDAAAVAGAAGAERALLHLHNMVLAEGGRLLVTARAAPARWGVALPDLASRLAATATAVLAPPDDALLAAVLAKHFADRQLRVAPEVVAWLVRRMERSLAAAAAIAARLDARALAEGRAVTQRLAAAVLDSPPAGGE